MDETQALISELVPPPRPAWRTAIMVFLVVALLTLVLVIAASGAAVPRMTVVMNQLSVEENNVTVVFHVRNGGWTDARVRHVDAGAAGLRVASVEVPRENTLAAGDGIDITVHYDAIDCDALRGDHHRFVTIQLTDALGIPLTNSYRVSGISTAPTTNGFVYGDVSQGWAHDALAEHCRF